MAGFKSAVECHADQLADWIGLEGKSCLDVGCGGGAFLHELIRRGAGATGLETDEGQLVRARESGLPDSALRVGRAEALPFAEASFDVVCCVFSFHHFPAALHDRVLAEFARVLRRDGHVFVVEPSPDGALTDVLKPIEDETAVRIQSLARLRDGRLDALSRTARSDYAVARPFDGPEAVLGMAVSVDPARAEKAASAEVRREVVARFAEHAQASGGAYWLRQPCTAFLFERRAAAS